ncbi:hypothetical protein ACFC09_33245 [Streptomyces sp. NPDC056161]|uniref:hypothetical protein n=1 Tax=Streptomyces sp. NPDC056161 TaxID=3345732 RepID=UPI0035D6ECAE
MPSLTVANARNLVRDAWIPGNRPDEFSGSLDVLVHVVQSETREAVARDLEAMDGTNAGMSLTRSHAVTVARRGLRPEDTQHGS